MHLYHNLLAILLQLSSFCKNIHVAQCYLTWDSRSSVLVKIDRLLAAIEIIVHQISAMDSLFCDIFSDELQIYDGFQIHIIKCPDSLGLNNACVILFS